MSTITHAHIHICIKRELHNSRSCGCLASLPARWTDLVEKWMHGNGGAGEYKIIPSQLNVGWKALLRLAFAAHIYLGVCLNIYSILKINNIYHNFECNFERVVMSWLPLPFQTPSWCNLYEPSFSNKHAMHVYVCAYVLKLILLAFVRYFAVIISQRQ